MLPPWSPPGLDDGPPSQVETNGYFRGRSKPKLVPSADGPGRLFSYPSMAHPKGRNRMRARLSLSFLLVMSLLLAGAPARATRPPLGHYIVVLNDSVSDPASVARQHALAYGAQVRFVYRFALSLWGAGPVRLPVRPERVLGGGPHRPPGSTRAGSAGGVRVAGSSGPLGGAGSANWRRPNPG